MKRLFIAALACVLACVLLGAPTVRSQEAPSEAPIAPTTTVNLNLEQQHTIKEFVKDLHLPKAAVKFDVSVGATVPPSVELAPMPTQIADKVPQVKTHRLFVTEGRIVLVNPNDQRIAGVIEDASSTGQSTRP